MINLMYSGKKKRNEMTKVLGAHRRHKFSHQLNLTSQKTPWKEAQLTGQFLYQPLKKKQPKYSRPVEGTWYLEETPIFKSARNYPS